MREEEWNQQYEPRMLSNPRGADVVDYILPRPRLDLYT